MKRLTNSILGATSIIVATLGSAQAVSESDKFGLPSGSKRPTQIPIEFDQATEHKQISEQKAARLEDIKGHLNVEVNNASGRVYFITAHSLGSIDTAKIQDEGTRATAEIKNLLQQNREIIGSVEDFEFRISEIRESEVSGTFIRFRQSINGIPVTGSEINISLLGKPRRLSLYLANPDDSRFNPSSWLSKEKLKKLGIDAWRDEFNHEAPARATFEYEIYFDDKHRIYLPTFKYSSGGRLIVINALTGELLYARSLAVSVRQ